MSRRGLLAVVESELDHQKLIRSGKEDRLYGGPSAPELPDDPYQNLRWEYEAMGVYISGHPLDDVDMAKYPDVVDTMEVRENRNPGDWVQLLGIVEQVDAKKPVVRTTRKGTVMAEFGISDLSGMVNALGFGEKFEFLVPGLLVHATGIVEDRDGEQLVKVTSIKEVTW